MISRENKVLAKNLICKTEGNVPAGKFKEKNTIVFLLP
jgi:hypothetical protein